MNIEDYIVDNRLKIIVRPNAQKNEICGWDKNRQALRVNINKKPEDNKANIEVIKFFSKLTGKRARIIIGATSKQKVLEFRD